MANSFKSPLQKAIVGWLAAHPETSQRELAKLADIDSGDLSRLSRGEKGSLNAEPALRLAGAMGLSVEELLAGESEGKAPANAQVIPLDLIDESPHNPRQTYDEQDLQGLADSIKESGLLQPLVVMRAVGGQRYELIFGHRRLRALKMNGAPTALCIIRSDGTTVTSRALQIIENLQRADIAPMDEARALSDLQAENPTRFTAAEIGRLIGKSDRFVAQRIAIARTLTPELQTMLAEGKIKVEVARALAVAPAKLQKSLAKDAWALRDADTVRSKLRDKAIPVSTASFKVELYDGEWLEEDGKRWFADKAKFTKLQTGAADARVEKLKKTWPSALRVGAIQLGSYVWADDGAAINGWWDDKSEAKTKKKGLKAEDCTALVYIERNKIRTAKNVVLRSTWDEKAEKPKLGDPAPRQQQQRESKETKEAEALNVAMADGLAARPDLARRLMVYAFIGQVREIQIEGNVAALLGPWADLLADFVQPDNGNWYEPYSPPDGAEDKLWKVLRDQDDATIDTMLGRLMSMSVQLGPYSRADGITRAIAAELSIDLPPRLIPEPIEEEEEVEPADQAAALEEAAT